MTMRWALVTGATAGIGREFAVQLSARGYGVVLVARDERRLHEVAAALPGPTEVLQADLLDEPAVQRVVDRIAETDRPIDLLVNNAGFGLPGEFDESDVGDELRQFDLLARVPLRLTHAALRRMVPRRTGTVIIVSSVAGFFGLGSYSAAKAWSLTFARWANAYYRPAGVTVTAVAPGFVRTEFHERMSISRESMAPSFMWFDAARLVRGALRAAERGRAISVPTVRYRLLTASRALLSPIARIGVARRGRLRTSGR
jgi:uncharacterized protein